MMCGFDSRPRYKPSKGFRLLKPFIFYRNLSYGKALVKQFDRFHFNY